MNEEEQNIGKRRKGSTVIERTRRGDRKKGKGTEGKKGKLAVLPYDYILDRYVIVLLWCRISRGASTTSQHSLGCYSSSLRTI